MVMITLFCPKQNIKICPFHNISITIWTAECSDAHIEGRLHQAVELVEVYSAERGLVCSPQKSEHLLHSPPGKRHCPGTFTPDIRLILEGRPEKASRFNHVSLQPRSSSSPEKVGFLAACFGATYPSLRSRKLRFKTNANKRNQLRGGFSTRWRIYATRAGTVERCRRSRTRFFAILVLFN